MYKRIKTWEGVLLSEPTKWSLSVRTVSLILIKWSLSELPPFVFYFFNFSSKTLGGVISICMLWFISVMSSMMICQTVSYPFVLVVFTLHTGWLLIEEDFLPFCPSCPDLTGRTVALLRSIFLSITFLIKKLISWTFSFHKKLLEATYNRNKP